MTAAQTAKRCWIFLTHGVQASCYDRTMNIAAGFVLIGVFLLLPASAQAQQIENTVTGSTLQSTGGGLQGSTPQIFDGNTGSVLNQSNQKLLDGLGLTATIDNQKKQEIKTDVTPSSKSNSRTFLASLCLLMAAAATLLWGWLRKQYPIS